MKAENLIKEFGQYRAELSEIRSRFTPPTSADMIHHHHINPQDEPRFKTVVIEIIDLLNDSIGKNKYSGLINQYFNEGISNYYESPSITSVENIISVIDAIVIRLKRNPELCEPKEKTEIMKSPDKIEPAISIQHSTVTFGDKNKIHSQSSQNNTTNTAPAQTATIKKILIGILVAVVGGMIVWYLTK